MTTHLTIGRHSVAITIHPNGTRTVIGVASDIAAINAALALWGMRI